MQRYEKTLLFFWVTIPIAITSYFSTKDFIPEEDAKLLLGWFGYTGVICFIFLVKNLFSRKKMPLYFADGMWFLMILTSYLINHFFDVRISRAGLNPTAFLFYPVLYGAIIFFIMHITSLIFAFKRKEGIPWFILVSSIFVVGTPFLLISLFYALP